MDQTNWIEQYVDGWFCDGSGLRPFRGKAFVSKSDCLIPPFESSFKTNSLLAYKIQLLVSVTEPCDILVQIEGKTILRRHLKGSLCGVVHVNLVTTEITEEVASLDTKLTILFSRQAGRAVLYEDSDDNPNFQALSVSSTQWAPDWKYRFVVLALQWVIILAFLLIVAANVRFLTEHWEIYAFAGTAALWLFALLGYADTLKIPIRLSTRQVLQRARTRPKLSATLLLAGSVVSVILATPIFRDAYIRSQYVQLIQDYERDTSQAQKLREAFEIEPWRAEARLLVEQHAWSLRRDQAEEPFRQYLQGFVNSDEARAAILRIKDRSNYGALYDEDMNIIGPLEWFVALVPQSEVRNSATAESLKYLDGDTSISAKLLKETIKSEIEPNQDSRQQALEALKHQVDQPTDEKGDEELYQVAADRLAQAALSNCQQDDAIKWFKIVLEERMRGRTGNGDVHWLLPPDVLITYQLYKGVAGVTSPFIVEANAMMTKCPQFEKRFHNEIYNAYGSLKDPEAWTQGTPFENKINYSKYIDEQLAKGWRY